MGFYFEHHDSMHARSGMRVEHTLGGIVRRYLGLNPPHPLTFRAYRKQGILRGADYRYHANFNDLLPGANPGQFAYAWGKLWSEVDGSVLFDVNCECPTVITVNRQVVFRSTIFEERYPDKRQRLSIALKRGWNHFVVRVRKTKAGFGGIWGTWLGKLPYYFVYPTDDRSGQEGWLYSEPLSQELAEIPGEGMTEADTGVIWYPCAGWSGEKRSQGPFERIFGRDPGAWALGWARLFSVRPAATELTLKGHAKSPLEVLVDDQVVFSTAKAGSFSATVKVSFGWHDVMVRSTCGNDGWGGEIAFLDQGSEVALSSPCCIAGSEETWIYGGPFASGQTVDLAKCRDMHRLLESKAGKTYWRLDEPETWVRLYNDNTLYGKWNYPLGVTLYGMLHAARAIGSPEAEAYVLAHVQRCCDTYDYAMWDRAQYGGATNVHHLLTSLDSLDDCGSFGSAMLEVASHCPLDGYRGIADLVADYISNKQIRLEDGTFFRKHLMHEFHEDTMWADDLYMSVPFLCRYYQLTGDARYIDDAARQFLGFKKRLYLPEWKLMSHVYDFQRGLATGVPWGRGNGWVIFSLSELLEVLPADHALRPELLAFFRDLCAGYLAQQDAEGMWHQVVNEHDSYPETSCTSMFTYAFARGVQFGWLEDPAPYVRAVFKAWEALNRVSIDQFGNVHGVCRGSEFSFQSEYYKKDLLWNLNDTHGIGIVLLAGIEVLKLTKSLQG